MTLPDSSTLRENLNKLFNTIFTEWLIKKKKDPAFEHYPDILLAEILREFFATVVTKKGDCYSKSAMINITSGLNQYLTSPPHKRVINLMHNEVFQNANKVFRGQLKRNKKKQEQSVAPQNELWAKEKN